MVGLRHVIILALGLRLLLLVTALYFTGDPETFTAPDTRHYLQPATTLVKERRYYDGSTPELFRPPGYPILLMLGVLTGHPYLTTLLFQALIGILTVVLVFRTGLLIFRDRHAALFSAGDLCL